MVSRARQIATDSIAALVQDVRDIKRELRELRAARRLGSSSIGSGALRILGPDGRVLGMIGDLSELGMPLRGVWLGRANGQPGLVVYDTGFIGLYDLSGNHILTDDMTSRRGLGRPYIPLQVGEISPPSATTTSGSFVDVAEGYSALQHPVLYAYLLVRASDGTTAGEVRLAVDGSQVGPTLSVGAGEYSRRHLGPFALPEPTAMYGQLHSIAVQARRTAGTGTIGVRVLTLLGLESAFV